MALTGYLTKLYASGTPVTLTSQAMTAYSTVARTYQVTTASKRIFSSTAALTFKSSAYTLVASDIVSVNYLFGAVTLSSGFVGGANYKGPPKVTGKYVPVTAIAGGHSYQLNLTQDLLDVTDYTSTGWRARTIGLKDATLSISRFDNIDIDMYSKVVSGADVLVEVRPGGTGNSARAWYKVKADNRSGDVTSVEKADVQLELNTTPTVTNFGWGAP